MTFAREEVEVVVCDRTTLGPPSTFARRQLAGRERVVVLRRGSGLMRFDASLWRREYVPEHVNVTANRAPDGRWWVAWLESDGVGFGMTSRGALRAMWRSYRKMHPYFDRST